MEIFCHGDEVVLQEIQPTLVGLAAAFDLLCQLPDDFERPSDPPEASDIDFDS